MRILIVSDAWEPQVNGVVRTYQYIIKELIELGHVVEVIGPNQFINIPTPGYNEVHLALFVKRKLAQLIKKFKPDAIHIAVEGTLGWAARRYCLRNNIAYTTIYHTQFPDYIAERSRWMGSLVAKWIKQLAIAVVRHFHAHSKCVFVATQSLEKQLIDWGFTAPMVRLVRGVNFTIFHPGQKTLFLDQPRPIQLYVGRVAIEKNIEAFLNIKNSGTKVIVGQGPALAKLQTQHPEAIFVGLKEGQELGEHFRCADIFVFPSLTDTFGMVLIEAMASGLPIAGYNVTGPKDIIINEKFGAVDYDLAAAIPKALASSGTPQERFEYAQKNYSWRSVAKTFLDHL